MKKTSVYLILTVMMASFFITNCQPGLVNDSNTPVARIEYSEIPSDSVLLFSLSPGIADLSKVYSARDRGQYDRAIELLAIYFKETAKTRYYFSWEDFQQKYTEYFENYQGREEYHRQNSAYFKDRYAPDTQWELPFKNLRGDDVTAYCLRHIARQSKHPDMVMMYFAKPGESENLKYWTDQMADLNQAFTIGAYDDGGNAVYEVFRAGKRTHHWLFGHHAYLSTHEYNSADQVETMRTFLHTAAQLAERGKKVRHGNHHTRGMVALFEIAATYREFDQSEAWLRLAIDGLTWHLENEINPDGFQFERTIHYHMSDIENFLRVWQMAKRGNIELPEVYTEQFRKMFDALLILGQPDRKLPVLQDDTDALHAEVNEMSGVMALGTILYNDSRYAYFVDEGVSPLFYWLLDDEELNTLESTLHIAPDMGSAALESTGYYVMRNGWDLDDEYMVITAGLSDTKPDHQHADMLGLVAYAHGNEILPNYQVKYNKPDFQYWKNSWVKNVALIDSIPQAQKWKGNSGGSGFGKWLDLPEPQVNTSVFGDDIDYFCGSHNGYKSLNISYQREVLFVKDGFWLVSDYFENPDGLQHGYQQLWQGKYLPSDPKTVTASFENGSTFEIQSLDNADCEWVFGSYKNKGSVIRLETSASKAYRMTSLLIPAASGQTGLPENWKLLVGSALKQAFPDLAGDGVPWVLKNGESILYFSDQVDMDKGDTKKAEAVFVFIGNDKVNLYGSISPSLQQILKAQYFKD
ncbi:MAG: heparinase II/III family protein [FCB group bacterium]|nr:heparinase II/III family protein [FCB group bacterium]